MFTLPQVPSRRARVVALCALLSCAPGAWGEQDARGIRNAEPVRGGVWLDVGAGLHVGTVRFADDAPGGSDAGPGGAGPALGLRLGVEGRRLGVFGEIGGGTFGDGGRDYRTLRIGLGIAWYALDGAPSWYVLGFAGIGALGVMGGDPPPEGVGVNNGGDRLSVGIGRELGPRLAVEVDVSALQIGGLLRQEPEPAFRGPGGDVIAVRAMLRYRPFRGR